MQGLWVTWVTVGAGVVLKARGAAEEEEEGEEGEGWRQELRHEGTETIRILACTTNKPTPSHYIHHNSPQPEYRYLLPLKTRKSGDHDAHLPPPPAPPVSLTPSPPRTPPLRLTTATMKLISAPLRR